MNKIYFGLVILILIGCKGKSPVTENNSISSSPTPNMLLPELLQVEYIVTIDTTSSDSWQKSFNSSEFLNEFRKSIYEGNISTYSPFYDDTAGAKLTIENVEADLGKQSQSKNFKWGKYSNNALGFIEKWNFDTTTVQFQKTTNWWYPGFFSYSDSSYHRMFHIFSGNATELLAENIIYEITFTDKSSDFRYLDYKRFFGWLVNSAIKGRIKVYGPDNFNTALDIPTLKQRLGEQAINVSDQDKSGNVVTSTVMQSFNLDELTGIIFIENWYYDKKTGNMSKKVNGFAPVRYYEDENGTALKSIPFVFYTNSNKATIL